MDNIRDRAMRDLIAHNQRVGDLLSIVTSELVRRSIHHDESKFHPEEWESFIKYAPQLKELKFGSAEYYAVLDKMKPVIQYHSKHNLHHPEHFENGINDMTLIDLLEMLCDWVAATERQKDGNIQQSFKVNEDRFGIGRQLMKVLENTVKILGK